MPRIAIALLAMIVVGCGSETEGSGEPTAAPATETVDAAPEETAPDESVADPTPEQEPAAEPGTREAPLPLGEPATIDAYEVAVTAVDLDATDAVMTENEFNEPPAEGNTYVLVTLAGTFLGSVDVPEGTPGWDLTVTIVGNDARQYADTGTSAVIANDLYESPTLEAGGTFEGDMVIEAPSSALAGASLFVESTFSFEENRVHWAIG